MKNCRQIIISVLFVFLATSGVLYGQYNPPDGGENLADFLSPTFLAAGASITSMESPQADALNPAASGLKQRVTLDAGYIGLMDLDSTSTDYGWRGHAANIGMTLPSKVGVFNWSGHFVYSPFQSVNIGTLGELRFSFAKDIYPNLLVGSGLKLMLGSNQTFDWGLALDLGFIHLPGDIGFMKDFRWGAVMQGMGKWYKPIADRTPYPAPFTLVAGAAFSPVRLDAFRWDLYGDIGFPSFQNVDLTLGTSFHILDFLSLHASSHLDLQELINSNVARRSFIPSFGIAFTFKTNIKNKEGFISQQGWNRNEVKIQTAAAPLHGSVWGFGAGANVPLGVIDAVPPDIDVDYPEEQYISPNNDGVSDFLEFSAEITDTRFVTGYLIQVRDEQGTVVKEIRNKDERPENINFRGFIDGLTRVKSGITVPDSFSWDGNSDSGERVPDGKYAFSVQAWDDNGNRSETDPDILHIDTNPPEIEVAKPEREELIFSPNDDGNKDVFSIEQRGSEEELWVGEIRALDGSLIKRMSWENATPQRFAWDGTNEEGFLMQDGVYSYSVSSQDRAGNRGEEEIANIIINTAATPITFTIDSSYFSPNSDGRKDAVTFTPGIPVKRGIGSWEISISNTSGTVVRRINGDTVVPETVVFDGNNDSGRVAPEGTYTARLTVVYENGNRPQETSPQFHLDLTPPSGKLDASSLIFSPNGDGKKDSILFQQSASEEEMWFGRISDEAGNVVKTVTWIEEPDSTFSWDGHGGDGKLSPDGTYTYQLYAEDKAGNQGTSPIVQFSLDTEETPLFISADQEAFSPNRDGKQDTIGFDVTLKETAGIEGYTFAIISEDEDQIFRDEKKGRVPERFSWDGRTNSGESAADGKYRAYLEIRYAKGNIPEARSRMFILDTIYPDITVLSDMTLFSPNGDGNKDSVTITHYSSEEERWTGTIFTEEGEKVRELFWKGLASPFLWDGTDEEGNIVPDGLYSYEIAATDKAGNSVLEKLKYLSVDTRQSQVFITADETGISPNGDGFLDSISFNIIVNRLEGLTGWKLDIVHNSGSLEKQFSGTLDVPENIRWNGRSESGKVVEGSYKAMFQAEYDNGNMPSAESHEFIVDVTAPRFDVQLDPVPFSPDNDGVEDELVISLKVVEQSGMEKWEMRITDPKGNPFYTFSGTGEPSGRLIWDGRSKKGELVLAAEDYPYILSGTDILGNSSVATGTVPVDILVLRDGDRLKIMISSINFAPNSPDLNIDNQEILERNMWILGRLAEILNKYSSYRFRIEGHAVSVFWADREKAEKEEVEELAPLSLSRAETVRSALVKLGVDRRRISVAGLGGKEPIVPHSDLENRWKNRRVEFILIK